MMIPNRAPRTLGLTAILAPLILSGLADAYPSLAKSHSFASEDVIQARQATAPPGETNCGLMACTVFDAKDQLVDVSSGSGHEFRAPGPNDVRGPCPGLNAAANHGFISRSGITTMSEAVNGLFDALGMGKDTASAAAAQAISNSGDPITNTFSIGGPFNGTLDEFLGGQQPQGLSYSHNRFESDSSCTRGDAYLYNGDAHSVLLDKFAHLYSLAEDDNFTPTTFRQQWYYNQDISLTTNPYYFSSPFGIFIGPASHGFAVNSMSNHSSSQPSGYLDRATLKSFWGVSGSPGSFVWNKGHERIPPNWYRRPSSQPYSIEDAISDATLAYSQNPGSLRLGGNTGTPNTFLGVDVGNLTGGAYDASTLLQGHNLGCFAMNAANAALPDFARTVLSDIAPAVNLLNRVSKPIFKKLGCAKIEKYNGGLFDGFPGAKYQPKGTDQPY